MYQSTDQSINQPSKVAGRARNIFDGHHAIGRNGLEQNTSMLTRLTAGR